MTYANRRPRGWSVDHTGGMPVGRADYDLPDREAIEQIAKMSKYWDVGMKSLSATPDPREPE